MSGSTSRARRRSLVAAVVAIACWSQSAVVPSAGAAGTTGATVTATTSGGGSGSAGASGHGSLIISSILLGDGQSHGNGGGGHPGQAPQCEWRTLSDLDIVFLLNVAASMPELHDAGLFKALEPLRAGGLAPGLELQVLFCDGVPQTDQVRARPAAIGPSETASAARRQLLTRLPPPELSMSPQATRAVLVNHPVFAWIDPAQWQTTVRSTLDVNSTTVDVEATPIGLDLLTGEVDSGGRVLSCAGPGRPWDPDSTLSAEAQASGEGACVMRYTKLTGRKGRRSSWTGYAQLHWDGRYRVDGGPWQPLGSLFSLRLFDRRVQEAPTVIQQP